MKKSKPNYGIDAPDVLRRLYLIGALSLATAVGLMVFQKQIPAARVAAPTFLSSGISFLVCASIMLWGSKFGKLRVRDRVTASLALRGDERVLDVGCGHGLMLIGAAKQLTSGRAVGVDLWQLEDQAGNCREATLQNATLEGVADRIELHDGDARKLPFESASFDAVVSSWALHNIYDSVDRRQAIAEIARVLKPGGRLAIMDIRHARSYARELRGLGFAEVKLGGVSFVFVTPSLCVRARKP